jgi:methionyl-tRNA formyltransferase
VKIVFAGTPEFAVPALEALAQAGHAIAAVYTQPDRPAGRGRKLQSTPVAQRAAALNLPVRTPEKFTAETSAELKAFAPEAMVVVAYGLMLPQAVLDIPQLGCFNIHASLLPRWRGAAPIQRAILAGDADTGITIMKMDAGLDTGPMVLQEKNAVREEQTAGELQQVLAPMGARLMVEALRLLQQGALRETAQPKTGATYAKKISKEEARLDWSRPAAELARQVRAYNPAPVAWTELDGERLRIYRATAQPQRGKQAPGTVLDAAQPLEVTTGDGTLRIDQLQRAGGKPLAAAEVVRGWNPGGKHFR